VHTQGMAHPALHIEVSTKDQKELQSLLTGGVQPVRVVLRALALRQLAKGVSAPRISATIPLTPQAIRKVGHRYRRGGLERALYESQRPGAAQLLDDSQKQRLIAMVCSSPPQGALDSSTGGPRSRETQARSPRRKRNHPHSVAQPRP
jgi:putative transposase